MSSRFLKSIKQNTRYSTIMKQIHKQKYTTFASVALPIERLHRQSPRNPSNNTQKIYKKRHRGASTGGGIHPSRGGHSSTTAGQHRGGSSNTATAPHRKTKEDSNAKRGGLHVTVMSRGGRGNQTSSHAPHDHTPWRGRGRGERGRGQHWKTWDNSRGFRGEIGRAHV